MVTSFKLTSISQSIDEIAKKQKKLSIIYTKLIPHQAIVPSEGVKNE